MSAERSTSIFIHHKYIENIKTMRMGMENIDVLKILQIGTPGLGFLLALLAFWLLSAEQKKKNPQTIILKQISRFMIFSISLCIIGIASNLPILSTKSDLNDYNKQENRISQLESANQKLESDLEKAIHLLKAESDNHKTKDQQVKIMLDAINGMRKQVSDISVKTSDSHFVKTQISVVGASINRTLDTINAINNN